MDQYQNSYSARAADIARSVKTHLQDAMETYFMSSRSVYEWCGVAVQDFQSYLDLLQDFSIENAKEQQQLVIQVLEEAINKMTPAVQLLDQASKAFGEASGSIASLTAQLNADFSYTDYVNEFVQSIRADRRNAQSCVFWICSSNNRRNIDDLMNLVQRSLSDIKAFHQHAQDAIANANEKIKEIDAKLKENTQAIGGVKDEAQNALSAFDDVENINDLEDIIYDEIQAPVNNLIEQCGQYQQQYTQDKETFEQN